MTGLTQESIHHKAGIYLYYANNCVVFNNNVSNNYYGIYLYYSSDNTLTCNNANLNSHTGIWMYYSSNNTLINNNANSNNYHGIVLSSSSGNTLTHNSAYSNNYYGILLDSLSGNTLTHNSAYLNGHTGIELSSSSENTLINNSANLNGHTGIYLVFSSNNTLISNSANSNNVGIYLFSSSGNNTLTSNSANLNKATGIVLALASSNNTLTNNSANSNNRYGIYLGFPSSNNTLTRNSANSNNYYGIVLDSSSNNKIYLNNFMNNNYNFYSFNSTNIWNSTAPISYTYKDKTYANYLGNYWTDYTNIDANNDGIWDNPRPIDLDKDYHPLVEPFENYEEKWSFAIITDSHIGWGYPDYGPEGWELAQEKNCLKNHPEEAQDYWLTERLNKSVDKIINLTDEYNIKFVVHLGDINDKGQYSELWKAKKILDRLNDAGIPYFPIIGNHEIWPYTQRDGDAAGGEGGQIIGYGVRWVGKGGQADSPLEMNTLRIFLMKVSSMLNLECLVVSIMQRRRMEKMTLKSKIMVLSIRN